MPQAAEVCCGCGIALPVEHGSTHPYMLGSAACWRGYGELLAVQYSDPARMRFHQVVVDAYAAQHPGGDDPRAVQSVAIHLMTLALHVPLEGDAGDARERAYEWARLVWSSWGPCQEVVRRWITASGLPAI